MKSTVDSADPNEMVAMPSDSRVRMGLLMVRERPNSNLRILDKLFTIAHKSERKAAIDLSVDSAFHPDQKQDL